MSVKPRGARQVACPRCGAGPGKTCEQPNGKPYGALHQERGLALVERDAALAAAELAAARAARARRQLERAPRVAQLNALGRPVRVALVGCAARKREGTHAAADLYVSPLFRAALGYARATYDEVWIVSAAHGLLPLEAQIASYDRTLRGARRVEREAWGDRVVRGLRRAYEGVRSVELVVLAGETYAAPIAGSVGILQAGGLARDVPGWTVARPLVGLGVGARLAWLRARTTALPAAAASPVEPPPAPPVEPASAVEPPAALRTPPAPGARQLSLAFV